LSPRLLERLAAWPRRSRSRPEVPRSQPGNVHQPPPWVDRAPREEDAPVLCPRGLVPSATTLGLKVARTKPRGAAHGRSRWSGGTGPRPSAPAAERQKRMVFGASRRRMSSSHAFSLNQSPQRRRMASRRKQSSRGALAAFWRRHRRLENRGVGVGAATRVDWTATNEIALSSRPYISNGRQPPDCSISSTSSMPAAAGTHGFLSCAAWLSWACRTRERIVPRLAQDGSQGRSGRDNAAPPEPTPCTCIRTETAWS